MDIICPINLEHKKNVRYENGRYAGITCHIWVHRIGSTVVKLYSETLTEKVFKLNPYYKCVAHKLVNGKQCTLV